MFNDMELTKRPDKFTKVSKEIIVNGLQKNPRLNFDLNDPNGVNMQFPPMHNVESVKLKFKIPVPTNAKVISAAKNNNVFSYEIKGSEGYGIREIIIPDGNYTPRDLRVALETLFFSDHALATYIDNSGNVQETPISVKYNKIDNKMYFASNKVSGFDIDFSEGNFYKIIGYENEKYTSSTFSKLDLYKKFPHDGFTADPFRLETTYIDPTAKAYHMIEPPESNSICLYNYDNILILLSSGQYKLNQSHVCIKDKERMQDNGANSSQQITDVFGHYVLGIQNSNGIITGTTSNVRGKSGLMTMNRLNVKFRYQNGEVVQFGKNNKDFNFLFEFTTIEYDLKAIRSRK